ncbi:MAG: hypothetical protein JXB04_08320, partial [Kiritimatiellae bacterium]|nr:hypothetical protein [Kiritimatiellia bacterium]
EDFWIELCGRGVPVKRTKDGIRAVVKDEPIDPGGVRRYLEGKFGDGLDAARAAMADLAKSLGPEDLAEQAYTLYTRFRPEIPSGQKGWGVKGVLDLDGIRKLNTGD